MDAASSRIEVAVAVPLRNGRVLVARRVVLEERTLRAELSGYGEYSGRVRYRLVPRVW